MAAAPPPPCPPLHRQLHRIPELAFEETKTSAHIRSALDEMGIPYDYPIATTGARHAPRSVVPAAHKHTRVLGQ